MEMFGPYRIERELGRGGMGQVHRAFDTRRERTVALKRLRGDLADDEEFQQRFRRECRLAARLSSPHIVPIHDFGEIDGTLFLDMRLVDGDDVDTELVRNGRLSPERAVDITAQVAHALHCAHEAGMVHRDVKPSNLLLTRGARTDFAYLVDFGIVRSLGADTRSSLTRTGAAIGTLAYMAPEVFSGGQVDRRVDVYALACVVWQMLAGAQPYTGTGPSLMYQHLHSAPPALTAARPSLPPRLDEVLARGMAKNPDDRPSSAPELAEAVRRALSGAPEPGDATADAPIATDGSGPTQIISGGGRRETRTARDRPRARRTRTVVLGALVLTAAALATGGYLALGPTDTDAPAATGTATASVTPAPLTDSTTPTRAAPDPSALRAVFPDITRRPGDCDFVNNPGDSTSAGHYAVTVEKCRAPGTSYVEIRYQEWADPDDARVAIADYGPTGRQVTWTRDGRLQGFQWEGTDPETGYPATFSLYSDRRFSVLVRGEDQAAVESVLQNVSVADVSAVPKG